MSGKLNLTISQRAILKLLTNEPQSAMRIGSRLGWKRASPTETAAKFCIQLTKLGLAEKSGLRSRPFWAITPAGRQALKEGT